MKIGIIGIGSAASVCATSIFLIYKEFLKNTDFELKVVMISDPKIPILQVGESLSPPLYRTISYSLSIESLKDYDDLNFCSRFGTRYTWENNSNPAFDVTHDFFNPAGHFNSSKFGQFVFDRLNKLYGDKISRINDNIKNIYQKENFAIAEGENSSYTFDYIFDCRGFPSNEELESDEYKYLSVETVNSIILFQQEKEYNHHYTESHFHSNGWQFGINTRKRKAYGYLYNKDITKTSDALDHFIKINEHLAINENNIKKFSWKSYKAKKCVNGRIIKMGNKLFFHEPIQGLSLHYYSNITILFIKSVIFGNYIDKFIDDFVPNSLSPEDRANHFHSSMMDYLFEIVLINYIGNGMNSDFWTIIGDKCKFEMSKSTRWINFCKMYDENKKRKIEFCPEFKPHPGFIIKQYIDGLNIDLKKFIKGEYLMPK